MWTNDERSPKTLGRIWNEKRKSAKVGRRQWPLIVSQLSRRISALYLLAEDEIDEGDVNQERLSAVGGFSYFIAMDPSGRNTLDLRG